jgi:hypothetical protein
MRGRAIRLSVPRRLVIDMLYFAAAVPTVPVQRRMSLKPLVEARAACRQRPRWTAIFAKGYALVAREFPVLRRAYIKIPWPHLYEYPTSNAYIVVERDYQGEPSLFSTVIEDPAALPFNALGNMLKRAWTAPIEEVEEFGLGLTLGRFPRPLRRLLMWFVLNVGMLRAGFYGTFAISVYSALDAESLHPLMPVTASLNYGVIDSDGSVNVRIIYDHRVVDGATVARALARLEEVLNTAIVEELGTLPKMRIKPERARQPLSR